MKKFLIFIGMIVFSLSSKAQTFTYEGLNYSINEDGASCTLTGYYRLENSNLIIPSIAINNGESYPVLEIGELAFCNCKELSTVNIPNSVIIIGSRAFDSCSNLKDIKLEENLKKIEDSAFIYCDNLTNIEFPSTLKYIGPRAFGDCYNLTNIINAGSVLYIGEDAFLGCRNLEYIDLGDELEIIEDGTFRWCQSLREIIIPNSVEKIGNGAFENCIQLSNVKFSDSLISIGNSAFEKCNNLTNLNLPLSLEVIGNYAFSGCENLKEVLIPNKVSDIGGSAFDYHLIKAAYPSLIPINPFPPIVTAIQYPDDCIIEDGWVYDKEYKILYYAPLNVENNFSVLGSVTKLGKYSFSRCNNINTLTLPANLIEIDDYCFYKCEELTNIVLPPSVETIGLYSFSNCSKLSLINLSGNIITLKPYTFNQCVSLQQIHIPNSIETIESYAFNECKKLTHIQIGTNLRQLGQLPFNGCNIQYAVLNCINIPDGLFRDNSTLSEVSFGSSVNTIGKNAFSGCKKLKTIEFPENLESIGESAFSGCEGLNTITFGNQIKEIRYEAFSECSGIEKLNLPASIEFCGFRAFNCQGLKELIVNWKDSIIAENNSFQGCYDSCLLKVPDNTWVEYVNQGWDIFKNFSTNGGEMLMSFDDETFSYKYLSNSGEAMVVNNSSYSYNLKGAYTIPQRLSINGLFYYVVAIGEQSFRSCRDLFTITLPEGMVSIGDFAFYDSGLSNIIIPSSLKKIGREAFGFTYRATTQISDLAAWCNIDFTDEMSNPAAKLYLNGESVTDLVIPNSITTIKPYAFVKCSSIYNLQLGESVTSIAKEAFTNCPNLKSILFNESLVSIGESAFSRCENLSGELILSTNCESIDKNAFAGCKNINSVSIPRSLKSIEIDAFDGCENIDKINISDISSWCNIKFGNEKSNPLAYAHSLYLNGNELIQLSIPEGTIKINDFAFYGINSLQNIFFPTSLSEIGKYSFGAISIPLFNITPWINFIDEYAFYNSRIENFKINQSEVPLTIKEENSFNQAEIDNIILCRNLDIENESEFSWSSIKSVHFGGEINSINDGLFKGNSNLKEIVIPSSVIYIGESAFENCSLTSISIGAGIEEIGDKAFAGNSPTTIAVTAIESPMAANNTFSNIAGQLLVTPGSEDNYYNNPNCWYRFNYPSPLVIATGLKVESIIDDSGNVKLIGTVEPADVSLPFVIWKSADINSAIIDPDGSVQFINGASSGTLIGETLYADGPVMTVVVSNNGNIISVEGGEDSGVDGIEGEFDGNYRVFSIQGINVLNTSNSEDLNKLENGLYIINGKKVMIGK